MEGSFAGGPIVPEEGRDVEANELEVVDIEAEKPYS